MSINDIIVNTKINIRTNQIKGRRYETIIEGLSNIYFTDTNGKSYPLNIDNVVQYLSKLTTSKVYTENTNLVKSLPLDEKYRKIIDILEYKPYSIYKAYSINSINEAAMKPHVYNKDIIYFKTCIRDKYIDYKQELIDTKISSIYDTYNNIIDELDDASRSQLNIDKGLKYIEYLVDEPFNYDFTKMCIKTVNNLMNDPTNTKLFRDCIDSVSQVIEYFKNKNKSVYDLCINFKSMLMMNNSSGCAQFVKQLSEYKNKIIITECNNHLEQIKQIVNHELLNEACLSFVDTIYVNTTNDTYISNLFNYVDTLVNIEYSEFLKNIVNFLKNTPVNENVTNIIKTSLNNMRDKSIINKDMIKDIYQRLFRNEPLFNKEDYIYEANKAEEHVNYIKSEDVMSKLNNEVNLMIDYYEMLTIDKNTTKPTVDDQLLTYIDDIIDDIEHNNENEINNMNENIKNQIVRHNRVRRNQKLSVSKYMLNRGTLVKISGKHANNIYDFLVSEKIVKFNEIKVLPIY